MKVVAFAASTSSKSINKQLVSFVAKRVPNGEVELLDLNDYELPLFSEDVEVEIGKPQLATDFIAKMAGADVLIISFAEHNGLYSAAYKNLFDWCSRQAGREIYQGKPMLLMATSQGARGGKSVLELATTASPRFGGDVRASVSVPSFQDNFDQQENTITNDEILAEIDQAIEKLTAV
jgi:NAD(P)H-dependent FMN reductase